MREIKFRQPIFNDDDNSFRLWHYWGVFDRDFLGPYSPIVPSEQYTGLKDKNGKEIYEGDIVEFDCAEGLIKQEVIFDRGSFTTKSGRMWGFEKETGYLGFYEVIGNIYENYELLKDNKGR